jgi:hypothetical protein
MPSFSPPISTAFDRRSIAVTIALSMPPSLRVFLRISAYSVTGERLGNYLDASGAVSAYARACDASQIIEQQGSPHRRR